MSKIPKRLTVFLPALYGGGAERVMLNLASGLSGNGFAVDLALAQPEGPYMDQIPDSVRLVPLRSDTQSRLRTISSLPALIRYLRQERPDAMLTALHANFIALWARRLANVPVRIVITEHNTFSRRNTHTPGAYNWITPRLIRRFYPWADEVVAVSQGVADDLALATGFPRNRIRVIYNPIIFPELRNKAEESIEHPWFQPGQPPVVLGVGRLAEQKDFGMLIRSFGRVREHRPARLMILGEGEERPVLDALIRKLRLEEDVQLPGFVPNPYPFMTHAAVFVLSSQWEGLPTVLVEALFCGVPLIATDCQSGPKEILRDGKYGRLVPVGDEAALAGAIEDSLDQQNRSQVNPESWRPFEMHTVIDQYLRILFGE